MRRRIKQDSWLAVPAPEAPKPLRAKSHANKYALQSVHVMLDRDWAQCSWFRLKRPHVLQGKVRALSISAVPR